MSITLIFGYTFITIRIPLLYKYNPPRYGWKKVLIQHEIQQNVNNSESGVKPNE